MRTSADSLAHNVLNMVQAVSMSAQVVVSRPYLPILLFKVKRMHWQYDTAEMLQLSLRVIEQDLRNGKDVML